MTIKLCDSKGFHMTFANGWTVSVQFGFGNYSSNRDMPYMAGPNPNLSSKTAEVAAWNTDDVWHKFSDNEYDTVAGYLDADAIAAFIYLIASKEA
jgi:hypothetical protein